MNTIAQPSRRVVYLDLLKSFLTVGMILAHVIQLIDDNPGKLERHVSDFVNLITFSGFMLAFGMGIGLSRRSVSRGAKLSRYKTPAALFAAYIISSIAYLVLVDKKAIGIEEILNIFLMRRLYGYSEFLAGFFLLSVVTSFARKFVFTISDNKYLIIVFAAFSVFISTIDIASPILPFIGALIGSHNYAAFPLLQYMPWFLLGVYYTRQDVQIGKATWAIAILATSAMGGYILLYQKLPMRFPPSSLWVVGPAFFLLICLKFSQFLAKAISLPKWLMMPGRHVLFFLVVSNIVLFTMSCRAGPQPAGFVGLAAYTILITGFIGMARFLVGRFFVAILSMRKLGQDAPIL